MLELGCDASRILVREQHGSELVRSDCGELVLDWPIVGGRGLGWQVDQQEHVGEQQSGFVSHVELRVCRLVPNELSVCGDGGGEPWLQHVLRNVQLQRRELHESCELGLGCHGEHEHKMGLPSEQLVLSSELERRELELVPLASWWLRRFGIHCVGQRRI